MLWRLALRNEGSESSYPVKLDDFFRLDYKTGSIYNQLTDKRAQVVPALPWSDLRRQITKNFGVNGAAFLFETGLVIGSTFGEEFMAHPAEPDALVRRLCELTTAAGWGTFAMIGDTKYGTQLNVVVANCIFCEGANALEEPACEILTGAIKGITDKVYGVPHRVFENRCIAMKDNICQVVVMEDDDYQMGGRPPVPMKERDGSFEDAQSDVVQKGRPPARFYPVRRDDIASRSEWPKA